MVKVLITGASKGIGYETALTLAKAGHAVVAAMRNPRDCDLAEVAAHEKLPIELAELDVDDDASVSRLFASGPGSAETVDVLVNNAGILSLEAVEDETLARFRQVMNTNFFGAVRCAKAVAPSMRRRRSGLIINISSIAGKIAFFGAAAYSASKFALEAFSEVLAQELAIYGVRVVVVEPGIIATPMTVANLPTPRPDSAYPQGRRARSIFAETPTTGPPPDVVAGTIRDIIDGAITSFRSPTGPDAIPFLQIRNSLTDEQWIAVCGAVDDDVFYDRIVEAGGPDYRPSRVAAN